MRLRCDVLEGLDGWVGEREGKERKGVAIDSDGYCPERGVRSRSGDGETVCTHSPHLTSPHSTSLTSCKFACATTRSHLLAQSLEGREREEAWDGGCEDRGIP